MMKILLFMLTIAILCHCSKKPDPEPVNLIPDNNFLIALIEQGVDIDGDGIITPSEAEAKTYLDVNYRNIESLDGIELFVNLVHLDCSYNQLRTLNVSVNTALFALSCDGNQITNLDLTNNVALFALFCYGNQLTSLDVSKNTSLARVNCSGNQLTNLDVSNNRALEYFLCDYNQLTNLDVSNNTVLAYLSCMGNQLTNLKVSNNPALGRLICSGNELTSLDVSNDIGLKFLYISSMPSLYKVCVWEMPFPPAGTFVDTTNSPNIYFTMDCGN